MEKVRVGIIGVGNMGGAHAWQIACGNIPGMELTALCDNNPTHLESVKERFGDIPAFLDYNDLLKSGLTDAVIIATPHYLHPPIAIAAFERGQHVLSEKPAGVYVKQIRAMNDAAKKSGKIFGIMFNQRTNPLFAKARQIVQGGELGELKRMVWIITNWYRSQHYYDSGSWRATWSGEGGGVLMNQAPHNLDLWQWICGMPKSIRATCPVGKYHSIEVEDEASIFAEYENGATAAFLTSTGEYPGTNRLEISGTLGKLVIEGGKLTHWRLNASERDVCFASDKSFPSIETEVTVLEQTERESAHAGILQNFAAAILHGEELLAPGYDGIYEATLTNAAYYSAWHDTKVTLPLDEDAYYADLRLHIESSSGEKQGTGAKAHNKYSDRWQVNW